MSYDRKGVNMENNGDDFYAALMSAHDGLSDDQSNRLNARLVLIMANHIGDSETLLQIIEHGKEAAQ